MQRFGVMVRKQTDETLTVAGTPDEWLPRVERAFESAGFKKVRSNTQLRQVEGDYRKWAWGHLQVTVTPAGDETRLDLRVNANVDNIGALFRSPGRAILQAFKEAL